MKIQSFSIVAGGTTCNARCPFCVARMTHNGGITARPPLPNRQRFHKACRFAEINGVTTVLITSKGEATLFPDNVTWFLENLQAYKFPIIELQSNGERIETLAKEGVLDRWAELGLNTVAISIVHHDPEKNKQIYFPTRKEYYDLPKTIEILHRAGISVRLSVIMAQGFTDTLEGVRELSQFARTNKVEQLTVRPVTVVAKGEDPEVVAWTEKHLVPLAEIERMNTHLETNARRLLTLMHGGRVYDFEGQNLCTYTCLTHEPDSGELRQIIFFPDGTLRYDWVSPAAILF